MLPGVNIVSLFVFTFLRSYSPLIFKTSCNLVFSMVFLFSVSVIFVSNLESLLLLWLTCWFMLLRRCAAAHADFVTECIATATLSSVQYAQLHI